MSVLPDFPDEKRKLKNLAASMVDAARRQADAFLDSLSGITIHEGDKLVHITEDGTTHGSEFREFSTSTCLDADDCRRRWFWDVVGEASRMGDDLASQLGAAFFEEVERATREAGTQFDAGGRPLDGHMFLDMLEGMDIAFDANDEPIMPVFLPGPALYQEIAERAADWDAAPEYQKRRADIISRKRDEWHAREARRRLVD